MNIVILKSNFVQLKTLGLQLKPFDRFLTFGLQQKVGSLHFLLLFALNLAKACKDGVVNAFHRHVISLCVSKG